MSTPTQETDADGRTTYDRQTVTIPVAPPRDPREYRATRHFSNRLRERVNERDRDQLPRTLIDCGRITRVAGDGVEADVPDEEHGATVAFTTTGPRERPWTLVAALRPVAGGRRVATPSRPRTINPMENPVDAQEDPLHTPHFRSGFARDDPRKDQTP